MEQEIHDSGFHHNHPSESIPNAAYPDDSAYRPGQGHLRPNLPPTQANSFSGTQATYPSSSGPSHSYSHGFGSSAWTDQALPTSSPSSPPPPYDPTNVPAAFTPLGSSSSSSPPSHISSNVAAGSSRGQRTGEQRRFGDEESIPLQTLSPAATAATRLSSRTQELSHTTSASRTDLPRPEEAEVALSSSSAGAEMNNSHSRRESYSKLGPVEAARRRKKRRAKICLILLSLAVVFLLALVLGVALSVLKRKPHHDDKDGDPYDQPPHGQQP